MALPEYLEDVVKFDFLGIVDYLFQFPKKIGRKISDTPVTDSSPSIGREMPASMMPHSHLRDFVVTSASRAHLLVRWVVDFPTSVPHRGGIHTGDAPEGTFAAPEAACAEGSGLQTFGEWLAQPAAFEDEVFSLHSGFRG